MTATAQASLSINTLEFLNGLLALVGTPAIPIAPDADPETFETIAKAKREVSSLLTSRAHG